MSRMASDHNRQIIEQFTRQAAPFAEMAEHSEAQSMRQLLDAASFTRDDTLLDVCCGPGLVSCAAAPLVRHVTGIDLTPAMLEQARRLQANKGLINLSWKTGDGTALPFADAMFSVVLSRYAFHHLTDPASVLGEMARVCAPAGRVVLADVFMTSAEQGEAYDRVERLRDSSHTRALLLDELRELFARAGLVDVRETFYRLPVALDRLLAATGSESDAAAQVRQLIEADLGVNATGFSPRREGNELHISFPVVILAGRKGA